MKKLFFILVANCLIIGTSAAEEEVDHIDGVWHDVEALWYDTEGKMYDPDGDWSYDYYEHDGVAYDFFSSPELEYDEDEGQLKERDLLFDDYVGDDYVGEDIER